MTVKVGDTVQWRNGPIEEVVVVSSQIAIIRDSDGQEHATSLAALEESEWSVNGERMYPKIDGYYVRSNRGLDLCSDLDTAWDWYANDRSVSGVIGLVDHGGWGEWYFANKDGDRAVKRYDD